MTEKRRQRGIHALPALVLVGVFAACILSVLLTGAGVYRDLTQRGRDAAAQRTAGQYLATKVHQWDTAGAVEVGTFGGTSALMLHEEIDGESYVTRIYYWDGYIRELFTLADGAFSPEDGEEELIELDVSLIHEEGTPVSSSPEEPAAPGREAEEVLEEMESPSGRIVEGLNRISEALIHGDVQAIRAGSRELSATADRYGMHTLADMARCFRAAWEEGDVEAAAQIVEEMRAEAARLQRP